MRFLPHTTPTKSQGYGPEIYMYMYMCNNTSISLSFISYLSRCYNCGDLGSHIAAKCPHGPLPKRCHNCKSVDHLIADCPLKDPTQGKQQQQHHHSRNGTNGSGASYGNGHGGGDHGGMFMPV